MRDHKYRAFYIREEEKAVHDKPYAEWSPESPECDLAYVIESSDYWVVQFTGLKDKNGVEIYEEDIVQDTQHGIMDIPDVRVYPVTWGTEFAGFNVGEAPNWSVLNPHDAQRYEVIGNIYENGELLK